jgi:hypothetical protein
MVYRDHPARQPVAACSCVTMQHRPFCSAVAPNVYLQADVVYKRDQPDQEWRFCFQCGKLEPLELFDGRQR